MFLVLTGNYFQFSVLSTFVQLNLISKSGCISTFKRNRITIFHFFCILSPKCKFDSTRIICQSQTLVSPNFVFTVLTSPLSTTFAWMLIPLLICFASSHVVIQKSLFLQLITFFKCSKAVYGAGVSKPGQPRRTQDFGNGPSFPLGVRGFKSHLLHFISKYYAHDLFSRVLEI